MSDLINIQIMDHGVHRRTLCVTRSPIFLRVVMVGNDWDTADVLDQPNDTPKPEERIYASRKIGTSSVHVDGIRNGRRFGKWMQIARYEIMSDQPSQEILRDAGRWQEWVMQQHAKGARS